MSTITAGTPTKEQLAAAKAIILAAGEAEVEGTEAAYNELTEEQQDQLVSELDDISTTFETQMEEAELSALEDADSILHDVIAKYGEDAVQYAIDNGLVSPGSYNAELDLERELRNL